MVVTLKGWRKMMAIRKTGFPLALWLVFAVWVISACSTAPQDFGTIQGHVSVSPLAPVTRQGEPEPTVNPVFYQDRQIIIYKPDGKTEFRRLKIDGSGNYQASLAVGRYVIDIKRSGIETAKELPKEIQISKDAITQLDIDLDTGIR
jgi:hypothetical protein